MSGLTYKDGPGRTRLPVEAVEQWEREYSGPMSSDDFYDLLWWIADHGYSIIPDAVVDEYRNLKENR